jgi:hypothetical protein
MMVWVRFLKKKLEEKLKGNGANIISINKNTRRDIDGAHKAFENKNIDCKGDHTNKTLVDTKT